MKRPKLNPSEELNLRDVDLADVVRFISKIEEVDGHWMCKGRRDENGYGMFDYEGRVVGAHRFSYALFQGVLPRLKHAHHDDSCRLKSCVKPGCLKPLSHKANSKEARQHQLREPKLF